MTTTVQCLRRLWPHLDTQAIAVTGSVAMDCYRRSRELAWNRPVNDIDFVAQTWSVVNPTVTSDFLVSHFHLPHEGYTKFLVQLVDPVSCVRVDIFPASHCPIVVGRHRRDQDSRAV